MEIKARLGTEKDIPFVKELCKASCEVSIPPNRKVSLDLVKTAVDQFLSLWPKLCATFPFKTIIAEDSATREPAGYMLLLLDQVEPSTGEKQAVIQDVAVSSKYRGKHLWKPMLEKAEELARENKNLYITGLVTVTNKISLALAEKTGFVIERYQIAKKL